MPEPTILYATFTALPGNEDEVARLIAAFGEVVRREEGNVVFDVTREAERPEHFFVYEEYRDEAAFQAHLAAPEGAVFNAALVPLIAEPSSQLTFLRRVG